MNPKKDIKNILLIQLREEILRTINDSQGNLSLLKYDIEEKENNSDNPYNQ